MNYDSLSRNDSKSIEYQFWFDECQKINQEIERMIEETMDEITEEVILRFPNMTGKWYKFAKSTVIGERVNEMRKLTSYGEYYSRMCEIVSEERKQAHIRAQERQQASIQNHKVVSAQNMAAFREYQNSRHGSKR